MAHPVMRSITNEDLEWVGYRPQKEDIHEHSWLYRRNKTRVKLIGLPHFSMKGLEVHHGGKGKGKICSLFFNRCVVASRGPKNTLSALL
jgi:hypothetical protein